MPGKAAALRTVFAAADLLQARAVVVLDPEIASVTPESVAALARPALAGDADFVSPAYARHPLDGPLVTQVVRPLFRAAYGLALPEPLAGEFGCSGRFAARCLEEPAWESDDLRLAIDLWISGMAAGDGVRVTEVALGPRRLTARPRPAVAALVPQVLDALFTCLRLQEAPLDRPRGPDRGDPLPPRRARPRSRPRRSTARATRELFREGLAALGPMLERGAPAGHARGPARGRRPGRARGRPRRAVGGGGPGARGRAPARHDLARPPGARRGAALPGPRGLVRGRGGGARSDERQRSGSRPCASTFERSRDDLVALWTAPAR